MTPRDREVARETVRPRHDCPSCNPAGRADLDPEGFLSGGEGCTCGRLYSYAGIVEPGQYDPTCSIHGTRDDLAPVRVEDLPPWPCCGARGPHAAGCPGVCGDTGPGTEFGYPPLVPCILAAGHTEDHRG